MDFIFLCRLLYIFLICLSVLGSPSRVCVCVCVAVPAALQEPSEKTCPRNFGACTLWVLLLSFDFCKIVVRFPHDFGTCACTCTRVSVHVRVPVLVYVPGTW